MTDSTQTWDDYVTKLTQLERHKTRPILTHKELMVVVQRNYDVFRKAHKEILAEYAIARDLYRESIALCQRMVTVIDTATVTK